MKTLKLKILSIGLLLCFGIAIIPAESFHQHEFESEICKENVLHFADHAVDCELASFIMPAFDLPYQQHHSATDYLYKSLITKESLMLSDELLYTQRGRAPPIMA